jgi:hypothetical protein
MDFDWLLEHATAIAFDPGRPSLYVFGLGMTPEELHQHVLQPMEQAGIFARAQTQFIDASKRDRYRGQLPRVALTLFDVAGRQCGVVLSYHSKFKPDLAQYTAWLNFWHQRTLEAAQATAQP